MELVASEETIQHVRDHGGAVYVWARKSRCCGGTITLEASTVPPRGKTFRRLPGGEIDLYLTVGTPEPESLHLEVGRRGGVRAFWNGLAWVA